MTLRIPVAPLEPVSSVLKFNIELESQHSLGHPQLLFLLQIGSLFLILKTKLKLHFVEDPLLKKYRCFLSSLGNLCAVKGCTDFQGVSQNFVPLCSTSHARLQAQTILDALGLSSQRGRDLACLYCVPPMAPCLRRRSWSLAERQPVVHAVGAERSIKRLLKGHGSRILLELEGKEIE